MAKPKKTVNPFYPVLLVIGFVFAVTACAYGVMAVKMVSPAQVMAAAPEGVFVAFLDQHGMTLLLSELAVLAVVTFAAIGTDDYWTRRAAVAQKSEQPYPES
jgi:hypothetical protein